MLGPTRPLGVRLLLPTLLVLSVISILSGILLVVSPRGEAMGAQTVLPVLTQKVPILSDFAPVGIFLLVVYGLFPLTLAYGLWFGRTLAWLLTLLLGITEIVWIVAEVVLFYDFGFFIFYPIVAGLGAVTATLCLFPSVRRFYQRT